MSKTNAFETSFLQHVFQNANIANIGDATGLRSSTTAGSLYIGLLTADPTEAGTITEANYTGYARVAVARTSGAWGVTGNTASNLAAITFGQATAGSSTVGWFGIFTAITSGDCLFTGQLSVGGSPGTLAISTSANQIPEIGIGGITVVED